MWVTDVRHYHFRAHCICITLCLNLLIFVHQRTLSHWDVFVSLRRRFLKISILGLKFSTPFENFNFNFEISRSVCRKLSKFDKSGTDRDTISEPPLNLRDFCGRGGASVFTTNLSLIHLSSQTCFETWVPWLLLSHHHPLTTSLLVFIDPSQGVQSYHDNPVGGSLYDDAMWVRTHGVK